MLHLTSCVRADVSPTETLDLARRIERGDVVLADWHENEGPIPAYADPLETDFLLECTNAREKQTIIDALRAFA